MKYLLLTAIIGIQMNGFGCAHKQQAQSNEQPPQSKAQRQPLEKQQREYKTPTDYELRDRGYDPKTGELITYDHKPRVEVLDAKAGKYAFKWIGYDGKEKTIIYQRKDAVDVIVSAAVSRTPEGKYLYGYEVQNLPSSGIYLSGFAVQNYAPDTRPVEVNGIPTTDEDLILLDAFRNVPRDGPPRNLAHIHIGQMSNLIKQFEDGGWIRFGIMETLDPQITPGRSLKVKLLSSAPPGVVGCRVHGGESTLQGVGEDMPIALANLLPGYREWPWGNTVGPVERLQSLSASERAKYLLEHLPQFQKSGWMTDEAMRRYEAHLKSGDLNAVWKRIEQDLKAEQITTEVFAILQAMQ